MCNYRVSKYNRQEVVGFNPGGPLLVERAGYRSTKQMVEEQMAAGRLLLNSRQEAYEYPDGVLDENAVPDPTRMPNFDLADATRLERQGLSRLRGQQSAALAAKAADDSLKVESKSVEQGDEKK